MEIKRYAVIGHPIGHTMSPFIHSRLFALNSLPFFYGTEDAAPENLKEEIGRMRTGAFLDGCNITIPYKRAVIPLLDKLDRKAGLCGSVNTVKNENGVLTGYTTDGDGFRRTGEAAGADLTKKVTILGAGGAARAIAFEAALRGADITLAAREHSAAAGRKLCADLMRLVPGTRASFSLIKDLKGGCELLVNATPSGMYPYTAESPAGAEILSGAEYVFDAVYNPAETLMLRTARENGAKTVSGMGMLVRQAAAAQSIWLGCAFDESGIERICREASFEMKKKFGNIVLCGFMGSGKTTVGRLLAQAAGRKFVDMDSYIEDKEKMSVSEIFGRRGEGYFRKAETKAAGELSLQSGLVIAAGGGTVLNRVNADILKANGITVMLDASLDAVKCRLKGDSSRPLLREGGEKAVENLYAERRGAYAAAAELKVNADGAPETVARCVLKELRCGGA